MLIFPCPKCETGVAELILELNFELVVHAQQVVIPQALIGKCNNCGSNICIGKEVKPAGTNQRAN